MDPKPISDDGDELSPLKDATLQRIADLLGVPVVAFNTPEGSRLLHTDSNGTAWVLMANAQGVPVVCCITGSTVAQHMIQESVATFLARDPSGGPQQALVSLIERLLTTHLAA